MQWEPHVLWGGQAEVAGVAYLPPRPTLIVQALGHSEVDLGKEVRPFWCQINRVRLCLQEGKRLGKAVWKPRELEMREVGMRAGLVTYKRAPFMPLYARKMPTARGGADHCPQTLAGSSRHDIRDQQGWDLYP